MTGPGPHQITQLDVMQAANRALHATPTGGDLSEHFDPATGDHTPRAYGLVENLITGVIQGRYDEGGIEGVLTWLQDMASEILAVHDALGLLPEPAED